MRNIVILITLHVIVLTIKYSKCNTECFSHWNKTIKDTLENDVQILLHKVKLSLKPEEGIGKNNKEIYNIMKDLNRIDDIVIKNGSKMNDNVIVITNNQLSKEIVEEKLLDYELKLGSLDNKTVVVKDTLFYIVDKRINRIKFLIENLTKNTTLSQVISVDDAFGAIVKARNDIYDDSKVLNFKQKRPELDKLIDDTIISTNTITIDNELNNILSQVIELEDKFSIMNQLVCNSSSTFIQQSNFICNDKFDENLNCTTTKLASKGLDLISQTIEYIKSFENQSNFDLIKQLSGKALVEAKIVMNGFNSLDLKKRNDKIENELKIIHDSIDKFSYLIRKTESSEIKNVALECINLVMSLESNEIIDLKRNIDETLFNLNKISVNESFYDLDAAKQANVQAQAAEKVADDIFSVVDKIINEKHLARSNQIKAEVTLTAVFKEMQEIPKRIETEQVKEIILKLSNNVKRIKSNNFLKGCSQIKSKMSKSRSYGDDTNGFIFQLEQDFLNQLQSNVTFIKGILINNKGNDELIDRAKRLKDDALKTAAYITIIMIPLKELEDNDNNINKYKNIVSELNDEVNGYLRDINVNSQYYKDCQP